MSKTEKNIGREIGVIAQKALGKDDVSHTVMSGVVKGFDGSDMTVKVALTGGNDDFPSEGVTVNVFLNCMSGMYMIPAINANCIVCEVDGAGKWELLKADNYDDVVIQSNKLTRLNNGAFGGLTKTKELQTQINKINTVIQHLLTVINGTVIDEPGSGAASALQTALKALMTTDVAGDFSDIENTNVTHG